MGYEHYIGVDLHKAFFQACAVTPDGTRAWEGRWPRTGEGIAALQARCTPGTAVAVEASTPTFHFADALTAHAGQVVIIDPVKTRLKAGYAAKTDRLDARRLADALRRESVVGIYHPPPAIRDLRELCRSRHALVQTRTALTLRLGAVLLRQGIGDAPPRLYRPRGLAWIDQLTLPAEAGASVQRLRRLLVRVTEELGRGRRGRGPRGRRGSDCDRAGSHRRDRADVGAPHSRGDRHDRPVSDARPLGQLCGPGAAGRRECGARAVRADHAPRVPVAALGARRSGDPWPEAGRRRGPVGPTIGDPQRRPESARRGGPALVRRDCGAVATLTSSPTMAIGLSH